MILRRALAAALVLSAATPAAARPLERQLPPHEPACWERTYDAAHLADHPGQKVVRVMLQQRAQTEVGGALHLNLLMNLRARLADDAGPDYRLAGVCAAKGSALVCENDWEAGSWRVEAAADGGLLVRNGGLTMNPNGWDSESEADDAVKVSAKPDDAVWKLARAPLSACGL